MESRVSYNTFYASWHEAMTEAELTDEQYGRMTRAINEYCFTGIIPELTGIEKALFTAFKPNIDSSLNAKMEGKKGGAPKGNKNAQKLPNNTNEKQPPLNSENNLPCLEKTTNGNGDGDEEVNVNEDHPESVSKLFIKLWQSHPNEFNIFTRFKDFDNWEKFWKQCNYSPQHIKTAVKNVVEAIRRGDIERYYVPKSPDDFVLNGWLLRGLSDFKPKEDEQKRNSNIPDADQTEQMLEEFRESAKEADTENIGMLSDSFKKIAREKSA